MSLPVSERELRRLIRETLGEVLKDVSAGELEDREPLAASADLSTRGRGSLKASRHPLPPPLSVQAIDRIVRSTPSRVVQGRTGTRYLTDVYLGLRADHAIALDAVNSELSEDFSDRHGLLSLRSRCRDHQEFLLHPDAGRRLDEESKSRLAKEGDKGVDIQIIAGDGLSAFALTQNGPALISALVRELSAAGFRLGKPLLVRFARVGVQDEIGLVTEARATLIIVGERPGLGTGDSLSIYTAFAPKLGQDNSEKDCISNIRALGLTPALAAQRCAELLRRTFAAGGGGIRLVTGAAEGQS